MGQKTHMGGFFIQIHGKKGHDFLQCNLISRHEKSSV
jgi:hypothetical protein